MQTMLVMVMRYPTPVGSMRLLTRPSGACVAGVRFEAIVEIEGQQSQSTRDLSLGGQNIK